MNEARNLDTATIERFYNTKELSKMLQISEYTVREYFRDKKIPAVKIGKCWKCSHTMLMQFMHDRANINQ